MRVTANGIKVLGRFYKGDVRLNAGTIMLAWFDPDDLATICVTDLKGRNPFTLVGEPAVDAFEPNEDDLKKAKKLNALTHKHSATVELSLRHDFPEEFMNARRCIGASLDEAETGKAMAEQQQQTLASIDAAKKMAEKAKRAVRSVGLHGVDLPTDMETKDALTGLAEGGFKAEDPNDL